MRQAISLLALSVTAAGAIAACRFVAPGGAQAGDGVNTLGVARSAAASDEVFPVDVLGTAIVESGGALTADGLLQSDAAGRAVDKTTGVAVARLAPGESATAAGQFVEVILITN